MALTPDGTAAGLHLLGLVLALGIGLRLRAAGTTLPRPQRLAIAAFTLAWIVLFAASAAFHLAPAGPWREALAVADDGAIIVVIAAAWTPLGPFRLPPRAARRLLAITWGPVLPLLALTGWAARDAGVQAALGWALLAQAAAPGLLHGRAIAEGFAWPLLCLLLASTLLYGGGMALYLRPDLAWAHAGWHAAVLAGCLCNHAGLARLIGDAKRARAG